MRAYDWYQSRKGQSLLVPGAKEADRGQCVQAADYALNEIYGLPYVWANAIDWWREFDAISQLKNNFDKVDNGIIQAGDFVVFNEKTGSIYGHIDIALQNGAFGDFMGADSNWGGNKTLHQVHHQGIQYVIGALRPKINQGELTMADITTLLAAIEDVKQTELANRENLNVIEIAGRFEDLKANTLAGFKRLEEQNEDLKKHILAVEAELAKVKKG